MHTVRLENLMRGHLVDLGVREHYIEVGISKTVYNDATLIELSGKGSNYGFS
jgi:hypothetical protein